MISFTGVGSTGKGAIERLVTQVVYLSCWDAGRIHIDVSRQHLNMQVWSLGRKQSWRWTYRNYLHWGIFSWKCRDRSPPPQITYKYIFKGRSKFLKENYTLLLCSMVRGPAASVLPRNCLEMQSLQPHSRLCELEFVSEIPTLFTCTSALEESWSAPRRGPKAGAGGTSAFMRLTDRRDLKARPGESEAENIERKV